MAAWRVYKKYTVWGVLGIGSPRIFKLSTLRNIGLNDGQFILQFGAILIEALSKYLKNRIGKMHLVLKSQTSHILRNRSHDSSFSLFSLSVKKPISLKMQMSLTLLTFQMALKTWLFLRVYNQAIYMILILSYILRGVLYS